MRARFEKRLIPAAEWTIVGLGLATVFLGGAFVWALATRAADALFGWRYHFQSIGDYFGIHVAAGDAGGKILGWDRSFLLLGAAMVAGYSASGVQGFIEWAQKSPEERRHARQQAREANARIAKPQTKIKFPHKELRKRMSGWRRLWIVLSILLGAPTFLIAYTDSRGFASVPWSGDNNAFWSAARNTTELSNCDWATAKASPSYDGASYYVSCSTNNAFWSALLWALLPAALMAIGGLTVRWVYRGFRSQQIKGD
jgi:hypothetical protein